MLFNDEKSRSSDAFITKNGVVVMKGFEVLGSIVENNLKYDPIFINKNNEQLTIINIQLVKGEDLFVVIHPEAEYEPVVLNELNKIQQEIERKHKALSQITKLKELVTNNSSENKNTLK